MSAVIRIAAVVLSGIVLLGFALFVVDEMNWGSQTQQNALSGELDERESAATPVAPSPADEAARERENDTLREAVDDANDVLLAPFASIVHSDDIWVNHGVPALLAVLVYGFGLGFLANLLPHGHHGRRSWRAVSPR
jgi:hypothetical protein